LKLSKSLGAFSLEKKSALLSKVFFRSTLTLAAVWLALGLTLGCGGEKSKPSAEGGSTKNAQPGGNLTPVKMSVSGQQAQGGVSPTSSGFMSSLRTVWVGSFLDDAPAKRSVAAFQKIGWTSFSVKRTLVDGKLLTNAIGDYHLVMVGLFGEAKDAQALGSLMAAQGLVANWQVVSSDNPGEVERAQSQTKTLVTKSERVIQSSSKRVGQPVSPQSPASTGEGFKKLVHGRYVGSYRDPLEAKKEAERLTAAGWPASVVTEGNQSGALWFRVFLAQPTDKRDFKTQPEELESARASAASQPGIVLLIDSSGLKGSWGNKNPNKERSDASACAGYSEAGRMMTSLERFVGYIPETNLLAVVKPVTYREPKGFVEKVTRKVTDIFSANDSKYTETKSTFGPNIYNRADVMKGLRSLVVSSTPAALAPAISGLRELEAIPGPKNVVLFSEFGYIEGESEAVAALGNLKGLYGSNLNFQAVYGDPNADGWQMAQSLAKAAGSRDSWNACRLLNDNAYFESFVRSVFPR
jgi:hypothetical protein